ncbi:transcription repressor OFP7-like [Cucurbita moschata]|uniref:Transcription repressor n=1 Tax=Cucurbita moschata TaxID=3662 RepID=A0A6J1HFG2_CUCMO|nr:transcription repressor OFP7-like [Cucurbita moschata]
MVTVGEWGQGHGQSFFCNLPTAQKGMETRGGDPLVPINLSSSVGIWSKPQPYWLNLAAGRPLSLITIIYTQRNRAIRRPSSSLLSMARSFKLKVRLFISSFRFCRPKHPHPLTFPITPSPENFHYEKQLPANPNSCFSCYHNPPSPPPSTPVGFFADFSTEESTSVCISCKLKSYAQANGLMQVKENRAETEHEISGEENRRSPFSWITRKKWKMKKKSKKTGLKSKAFVAKHKSYGYEGEEGEGTEALLNSSISFSSDGSPVKRSEIASCPSQVEWKMGESLVQVKRSKEPQEDFKRSMVQMILEKEIFEAKGLEDLLQCYLALNSPEHHGIIVGAFSEVWEFLFYHSHSNK